MKKKMLVFAIVVVFSIAVPSFAEEKVFDIDDVHSSLTFKIRHLYTTFTGRFNSFKGTISGDLDNPATLKVEAEVDILSIDTANDDRDKHLRAPDFFNTKFHPTARFKSTRTVVDGDARGFVTGNLTICGITKEITFYGRFSGYGPDHRKGTRVGFHAEATIDRTDFGMKYNAELPNGITILGTEVEIILEIEAIEKTAEIEKKPLVPLADRIDKFKSRRKKPLPKEISQALEKAIAKIMAKGGVDGLNTGDMAPDFSLHDMNNKRVSLEETLRDGPVVLVFYRGEWCPFCNLQLKALEEVYPEMKKLGASLIGITPQKQEKSLVQRKKNALSFPLLTDSSGDTMRAYRLLYQIPPEMKEVYLKQYNLNLEEYNGEGRWELPVTATYVIGTDGIIKAGLVDMDYTKRMEPQDILEVLQDMRNNEK